MIDCIIITILLLLLMIMSILTQPLLPALSIYALFTFLLLPPSPPSPPVTTFMYIDIAVILASDGLWNFVTAKDCANVLSKITENHHHSNRTSPSKEEAYNDQKNSIPLEYKYDSHIPPDEMAIKEGQAYQPREGAQQGLLWDSKMSPMADKDGQDGNDSGDKTVSNLQGGQDDASKELLSICLQSAAKYAHINVNQLQNMPAGERRRGIVDDITVMVLQFE